MKGYERLKELLSSRAYSPKSRTSFTKAIFLICRSTNLPMHCSRR